MFTPRPHNPVLAALLTLLAAALLAGTTLLAKALGTGALGQPMHPLQISHGRFLFALMAIGMLSVMVRPRWTRPDFATHIGRSCLGWGGVTLMFAAAAFIPLSDATAISFLNPVFGMILAVPLLGERVGPVRWGAAGIALVGAAILTRPGGGVVEAGALLALGAAVCLGAELIFIKRLSGREGPLADPAHQQCRGSCHRKPRRSLGLGRALRRAMGGIAGHRPADGAGTNLLCQCNGTRRCQFRRAVLLHGAGLCRAL